MKKIIFCSMFAILIFGFVGCGTGDSPNQVTGEDPVVSPYQVTGEDPVILVHNLEYGMEAEILGILEYDSNSKCLFLNSSDSDKPATPIWPKGTTPHIDNNLHGVEVPGYGTILEGDSITAGGGGIESSEIADLDVPSGCLAPDEIVAITDL